MRRVSRSSVSAKTPIGTTGCQPKKRSSTGSLTRSSIRWTSWHKSDISRVIRALRLAATPPLIAKDLVHERNAPVDAGAVDALRQHPRRPTLLPDEID